MHWNIDVNVTKQKSMELYCHNLMMSPCWITEQAIHMRIINKY